MSIHWKFASSQFWSTWTQHEQHQCAIPFTGFGSWITIFRGKLIYQYQDWYIRWFLFLAFWFCDVLLLIDLIFLRILSEQILVRIFYIIIFLYIYIVYFYDFLFFSNRSLSYFLVRLDYISGKCLEHLNGRIGKIAILRSQKGLKSILSRAICPKVIGPKPYRFTCS